MNKEYYFNEHKIYVFEKEINCFYVGEYFYNDEYTINFYKTLKEDTSKRNNFFVVSDLYIEDIPESFNARYSESKYYIEIEYTEDIHSWLQHNSVHWILVNGNTKEIFNWCDQILNRRKRNLNY